jgi:hypothetical protein
MEKPAPQKNAAAVSARYTIFPGGWLDPGKCTPSFAVESDVILP